MATYGEPLPRKNPPAKRKLTLRQRKNIGYSIIWTIAILILGNMLGHHLWDKSKEGHLEILRMDQRFDFVDDFALSLCAMSKEKTQAECQQEIREKKRKKRDEIDQERWDRTWGSAYIAMAVSTITMLILVNTRILESIENSKITKSASKNINDFFTKE